MVLKIILRKFAAVNKLWSLDLKTMLTADRVGPSLLPMRRESSLQFIEEQDIEVEVEVGRAERQPVISAAALTEEFLQLLMWGATMAWEAGETSWE